MKSITSSDDLYKDCRRFGILVNQIGFRNKLIKGENPNYIINLASAGQEGTHWVALYLGDNAYYFDSFGQVPPLEVLDLIDQCGYPEYFINAKQIQDIRSGFCGEYCVLFLKYMNARNGTEMQRFSRFQNKFRDNSIGYLSNEVAIEYNTK